MRGRGVAITVRVLVAGGAGFLGRAIGRSLLRGGHRVSALVRSEAGAARCRTEGIVATVGDVTDRSSVAAALHGCDAVVHVAQAPPSDLARMRAVRVGGAEGLLRAAKAAGTRRVLIGSGYWVYAGGPGVLREESPVAPRSLSLVNFEAEEAARRLGVEEGVEVIVLRPGMVYGDGSWFGEMVSELQDGSYRYVGDGSNHLSPVHLDDAADGFRAVLERGRAGDVYLVVDDAPATHREFAEFVAHEIHAPAPAGLPLEEAIRAWGEDIARLNAADRRASNARLRALGWAPSFPSYREGVPPVLRTMRGST